MYISDKGFDALLVESTDFVNNTPTDVNHDDDYDWGKGASFVCDVTGCW